MQKRKISAQPSLGKLMKKEGWRLDMPQTESPRSKSPTRRVAEFRGRVENSGSWAFESAGFHFPTSVLRGWPHGSCPASCATLYATFLSLSGCAGHLSTSIPDHPSSFTSHCTHLAKGPEVLHNSSTSGNMWRCSEDQCTDKLDKPQLQVIQTRHSAGRQAQCSSIAGGARRGS